MAVSRTRTAVTKTADATTPASARRVSLAKNATGTGNDNGGGNTTNPATLQTTITGSITIGSDPNKITVPVESFLPPPPGPSGFVFYLVNDPTGSTKIKVGEFIAWAFAQLGGGSAPTLPTSLTDFTVALKTLNFDTAGDFDIKVEIGSDKGGTWTPSWQPLGSSIPLTLENVTLEFVKGTVPPKPTT